MINFQTSPDQYKHWKLSFDGAVARLSMDVAEDETLNEGYKLKLNSYDLGVDIELADAIQRIRFEHPEVRAVVITSLKPRIFCAGANIYMLGTSSHAFKVNFCKFTNETRCAIEDDSRHSGRRYIAALNGTASGGGYELAIACDEIYLVAAGNSAVSLPEVPLLGVLPVTGGLTRLVDKRRVRRDHAAICCTTAEGIKGQSAVDWHLVDGIAPKSRFEELVQGRLSRLASGSPRRDGPGVALAPLVCRPAADGIAYTHLQVSIDRKERTASFRLRGPDGPPPADAGELRRQGSDAWMLRLFRELDDAVCRMRFNEEEIGLWLFSSEGDADRVTAHDTTLARLAGSDWFAREILLHAGRTLRRLDVTARSLFALVEPGSCFVGSVLEILLASDRSYALDDETRPVTLGLSPLNFGALPMGHGPTRLETRLPHRPEALRQFLDATESGAPPRFDARAAAETGIVTVAADDIDYPDEVRVAIEERTSLSPDALTGMEASLRFPGMEAMPTKIFGRLSAWQNWIFQRPNATGDHGALKCYGKPSRPVFDWRRT